MKKHNLQTVAGIHLSGPNAHKTSVVIMTGGLRDGNLKISQVFEKIGGVGKLFSDERLYEIIRQFSPDEIFVDCPLTEPPCVSCARNYCPGVNACEDLGVAYMQSIAEGHPKGRRRRRPLNPQTQRLWDVIQWSQDTDHLQEPSYSANMAPLVVRAKTLQRRLNALDKGIELKETLVPLALRRIGDQINLPSELVYGYRSFGIGRESREKIVEILYQRGWLALNHLDEVAYSAETFHSLIAGIVAVLYLEKRSELPKNQFFQEHGWVFLPESSSESE